MPVTTFDGQARFKVRILPYGDKFVLKSNEFGFVTSVGTFTKGERGAEKFDSEVEAKTFANNYDLTVVENSD